ncbi:hypothetical protein [Plantactinospora sp. KLBMP9567]|nr:hypothetical protein [Plantactinospora sp. KLBMP9567]MDW5329570.1 hypothetical protein [Plantactinospora sp. KLBMP9567]
MVRPLHVGLLEPVRRRIALPLLETAPKTPGASVAAWMLTAIW